MEFLHPGVFVQEVSGGVQPIEGVSTSTTGFIGKAAQGQLNVAQMVTSFTAFQSQYGGFLTDGYLAHAALAFFNNGGRRLYVVRVARNATTASVTLADREAAPVAIVTFSAKSPGQWADDISLVIANGTLDTADEMKLTVKRGTTVLETFDDLSMNPDAPNFVERAVATSQYVVASVDAGVNTTAAGTSVSTGTAAVTLPAGRRSLMIDINGDGPQMITLADPVTDGGQIATALNSAVHALAPLKTSTPAAAFSGFDATFAGGKYTLTSGSAGKRSSVVISNAGAAVNAAGLLGLGVLNGGTENTGAAALRAANGTYSLSAAAVGGAVTASTAGADGTTPQDVDYTNGFTAFDNVQDVNILAVPGVGSGGVVDFGTNYCTQRQDCFFIGDMAPTDNTPVAAQTFVNGLASKTSYGAVYFPWLRTLDPTGLSASPILTPPSGALAGIYARIDARRGVWKAPAGTEANVGGAVTLAGLMNDGDQDTLNPIGANLIRFFPSSGIVVWGARTLATRSNPEYRYVPVRRLAIFLERSIYNGIQWAVFEPNDEPLWSSLRLNVGAFMMNQFRAGAFQGSTPSQAFFVRCDGTTNPQSQIDAGIVTVVVGFAPLKPAEFVLLQISQKTAGAST